MSPTHPLVPAPVDESRFPALAAYVRRLPGGLAAYPEAQMKASIYREALADKPLSAAVCAALPPDLADIIAHPRLVSSWVPSVVVQALFLTVSDVHGLDDDAFVGWSYVLQKRLYRSPLYRALTTLASPTLLLHGTRVRWSSIHRGTELEVVAADHEARLVLLTPPNMYATRNLLGFAAGFRSVIELSNATNVHVDLSAARPTKAEFLVRWE